MKKLLFTGGTGFFGRNLVPILKNKYLVLAPGRAELNLKDTKAVENYIKKEKIDVIIHAAIPNLVSSKEDIEGNVFKDSLKVFMNLYRVQDYYGKMIYFGSGAEFDKKKPIVLTREEEFGNSVPKSEYGFAKYIMNSLSASSKNIYNLRIFGCYGPTDAPFKLITHVIRCCLKDETIKLHQNCVFDYMYVTDLTSILDYFINNNPKYHDYNACTGVQTEIMDICRLIQEKMNCSLPVELEKEGLNNEYTGNNSRLLQEIPNLLLTSLSKGIEQQIKYEKEVFENEKTCG